MTRTVVVFVTAPSLAVGRRLAQQVVKRRLAACVNLLPGVESYFTWQGRLDRAREVLLILKTTARRVPALQRAIKALHPYDLPEVIVLPIASGSPAYLAWVRRSVA